MATEEEIKQIEAEIWESSSQGRHIIPWDQVKAAEDDSDTLEKALASRWQARVRHRVNAEPTWNFEKMVVYVDVEARHKKECEKECEEALRRILADGIVPWNGTEVRVREFNKRVPRFQNFPVPKSRCARAMRWVRSWCE